ncbi:MAG: hypothetical protein CMA88_02390 [Euryarchaeota archaeon]|nr:hypothetical protein [Euryarchaeota archaeon]
MYDFHNSALTPTQAIILNAAILSIIVVSLVRSERLLSNQSQWTMMALLVVFGVSGRILMEPLPNIQPVTVLVIMAGAYYGAHRAFALAATIALASNILFLGHGPWTIFQAVGWGALGVLGASMSDRLIVDRELRVNLLAVVAAASGFFFNWIVSLSILLTTDPSMLMAYLLNGLVFDLYHAAGNVAFVAWMSVPLGDMMLRHRKDPTRKSVRDFVPN